MSCCFSIITIKKSYFFTYKNRFILQYIFIYNSLIKCISPNTLYYTFCDTAIKKWHQLGRQTFCRASKRTPKCLELSHRIMLVLVLRFIFSFCCYCNYYYCRLCLYQSFACELSGQVPQERAKKWKGIRKEIENARIQLETGQGRGEMFGIAYNACKCLPARSVGDKRCFCLCLSRCCCFSRSHCWRRCRQLPKLEVFFANW